MFFLDTIASFFLWRVFEKPPAEMKVENDDSFTRIGPNDLDAPGD
jgi:hypothetical protein